MSYIPQDIQKKLDTLINNHNMVQEHKIHQDEINALTILLNEQYKICSTILKELIYHKRKINCWAWYIFPTWRQGRSDSLKTYITVDTAQILLKFAPPEWRSCLEKIIELTLAKNNKLIDILPKIDISRVNEFVIFWNRIPNKLKWFEDVLQNLELFIQDYEIQKYLQEEKDKILFNVDKEKKREKQQASPISAIQAIPAISAIQAIPAISAIPVTVPHQQTNKIHKLKILIDEHFTKINNLIK